MNRIVLIGNGFDLAHHMKTSYNHFLDDFWQNLHKEIQKKEFINLKYEDEFVIIDIVPSVWVSGFGFNQLQISLQNARTKLRFKNKFLELLTSAKNTMNWVDIESDYYTLLKSCYQKPNPNYTIRELNENFLSIQKELEKYLTTIEKDFINSFPKDSSDVRLRRSIIYVIFQKLP